MARQATLSALFVALIAIAGVAIARAPYALVASSRDERAGISWIRDTQALLDGVARRQLGLGEPVDKLQASLERVLQPRRYGIGVPADGLETVRRSWAEVARRPNDELALSGFGSAAADLVSKISDASQLSYDQDVDLINFGDATAYQLPKAVEYTARAAELANRPPAALTVSDRIAIARLTARSEVGWSGADNDFRIGIAATSPDAAGPLALRRNEMSDAFDALLKRLNAITENPTSQDAKLLPGEYRRYEVAAQAYLSALDDTLDALLARRIDRENGRIAFTCVWVAIALAAVLTLLARISKGMLARERRALQIEKERARALENELARREAERARLLNEAQFRTIFDGSPLGIATLDRNGSPLERNPVLLSMIERFSAVDKSFDAATFGGLLAGSLGPLQLEREVVAAGGYSRWIDLTVFPMRVAAHEDVAAIAMLADVTDRKLLSERLRYEARHDALTGLLSRNAFLAEVAAALDAPPRGPWCQAIILIDLDRFKLVNDTQGHAAGDDVLRTIAKRLRDVVRAGDVIARLHGDEFALFVTTATAAEITACIERIQLALRVPILIDGQPVCVDSSIGICVARPEARADDILQNADTAMYAAKRAGRGRFVFFDGSMQEATSKWMRLASDMLLSLERGEFRVAYQPIVALDDGTIAGFEALLRWNHHELGEISPVTFIPIAEETGAIVQLGRFVLGEACRQLARWDWEHRNAAPITMSVNLSAHQLAEYVLVDVEQCIAESGIAGHRLILEITESALLESGAQTLDILTRLRASGVRLCLDDFGTGYSSLRYLQDFPIDQLKIDRSFVGGSDGSLASEPIVRMLINLAETMGVQVVAEGVESQAQREQLVALGCRFGQGFLFSRPQAPGDFTRGSIRRPMHRATSA